MKHVNSDDVEHRCRVCDAILTDENWYPSFRKEGYYLCKECRTERRKKYRMANADKIKEQQKKYYVENADKLKREKTKYREDNKERMRIKENEYYEKNKDKINEQRKARYHANHDEILAKIRVRTGGKSMEENKECSQYLGVHVAERVLANVFDNVTQMPNCNPGYDFICNHGHKIDVKSSCLYISGTRSPRWLFTINRNTNADYFLCIAFDNRTDLNPQHLWLIPGIDVCHLVSASISKFNIPKWDKYALPIDGVLHCCDVMKK